MQYLSFWGERDPLSPSDPKALKPGPRPQGGRSVRAGVRRWPLAGGILVGPGLALVTPPVSSHWLGAWVPAYPLPAMASLLRLSSALALVTG
jgi:hypothetical protein